ncbi:MAG: hypothetical protein KBH78_08535 [Candidatus Hydrogenedentes bacterium]|nr:hypothetical protein [Candidatus Hydrogenedentota bacterium]
MRNRLTQIGFSSQKLRYAWLAQAARLCLAGVPVLEAVQELRAMLGGVAGDSLTGRGSRERALTLLRKIWFTPDKDLVALRDTGLNLLRGLPRKNHIAIHWGMVMASYPFWARVGGETGKLLRLQSSASARHVRRRLVEHYGDREIVARATRNVLRSFIEWGVLQETSVKGIYTSGLSFAIDQVEVIAWLVEAFLHAHPNGSVALRTVLDSTSLFPFRLSPISADHLVAVSGRLDVLRQDLDQDLIMLRPVRQPGRTESLPATKGGGS